MQTLTCIQFKTSDENENTGVQLRYCARCHPDSNRRIKVLQTFALPLGYGTNQNGAVDGTRTRDIHLGKVALYQLSYYRMNNGALGRNRTTDTVIFSHMLYQLSYQGRIWRPGRGSNPRPPA